MTVKKKQTSVVQKRRLEMRSRLWNKADEQIWKSEKGWLIVPRAMPLILRIMDIASPKGKPVSQTYFDLWCRTRENDGFVIASNPKEMAFFSGFSGERAESTWATRMRILEDLGFIETKEGSSGSMHYALLLNPYSVIESLHKSKKVQDSAYNALIEKMIEIGETDFDQGEL